MEQERAVKTKLREKRQVSARARKYYDEYQLRMRARMLKRRTKEEQVRTYYYIDFLFMTIYMLNNKYFQDKTSFNTCSCYIYRVLSSLGKSWKVLEIESEFSRTWESFENLTKCYLYWLYLFS